MHNLFLDKQDLNMGLDMICGCSDVAYRNSLYVRCVMLQCALASDFLINDLCDLQCLTEKPRPSLIFFLNDALRRR